MIEPEPDTAERAIRELEALEHDPVFTRAPVMQRLLRFLVEESLAGRGDALKSFTVAVDGLGREPDFDPQADSYPRVLVGRLRKMLDAHYAVTPAAHGVRFHIPAGGYRVDFLPAGDGDRTPGARWRWLQPSVLSVCAMLALTAVIALAVLLFQRESAEGGWTQRNFPIVEVAPFVAINGTESQRLAAAELRMAMVEMLSQFDTLVVTGQYRSNADYRVKGWLRAAEGGTDIRIEVVVASDGRVVWSRSRVRSPAGAELFDIRDVARVVSGAFGHTACVLHSHQRQQHVDINTPYGCWLAFMDYWHDHTAIDGGPIKRCIDRWLDHHPQDALAHALKALMLIEEVRTMPASDRRRQLLLASAQADEAIDLNPRSGFAYYAQMQAALYQGNAAWVREHARKIQIFAPSNPELLGLAGLHLVLIGDASGRPILASAIEQHSNPPIWFYMGLVVAAILEDDVAAARDAAQRLHTTRQTMLQRVLLAMVEARQNRLSQARRYWADAVQLEPRLATNPETALAALPLAPQLRRRCLDWLRPAV
jgi:TolB-like protein